MLPRFNQNNPMTTIANILIRIRMTIHIRTRIRMTIHIRTRIRMTIHIHIRIRMTILIRARIRMTILIRIRRHPHSHDHTHSHSDVESSQSNENPDLKPAENSPETASKKSAKRFPRADVNVLKEILESTANELQFNSMAKNFANSVLNILIEAEAEVHGTQPNEVHFHEVGSVDTLIDILGTTVGLNELGLLNNVANPITNPENVMNFK